MRYSIIIITGVGNAWILVTVVGGSFIIIYMYLILGLLLFLSLALESHSNFWQQQLNWVLSLGDRVLSAGSAQQCQ